MDVKRKYKLKKLKSPTRSAFFVSFVCSLVIHMGLFLTLYFSLINKNHLVLTKNNPIRVSLSYGEKSKPSKIQSQKNVKKSLQVTTSRLLKPNISVPKETPIFDRYQDILPQMPTGFAMKESDKTIPGSTNGSSKNGEIEFRYFDENEKLSAEERIKDTGEVQLFGKELIEQISIPFSLKEIVRSGEASVTFERSSDGEKWSPVSAYGDPYFRAVLYETLLNMSPLSYGLQILSRTEINSVKIYLTYRTKMSMDATRKPASVEVNGRKIFLTIEYAKDYDELSMFSVDEFGKHGEQPKVVPMINFLGIGMYAIKKASEDDLENDPELRKLRTSPAFVKPIGK